MTYFKLDIPKLNDSISLYKSNRKECIDDINTIHGSLSYTETAWSDDNSSLFVENVKTNKYKIHEYFSYLDDLYNEIEYFKCSIDNICAKQGYKKNSVVFKYDDTYITDCIKYLNNSITILNNTIKRLSDDMFDSNFKYIKLINELKVEINIIRKEIINITSELKKITNSVKEEITESKYRLNKIDKYNLNINVNSYIYKIQNINVDKWEC